MISPPHDSNLPVNKLSSVFNDTTNSYKFYWFLAILEDLKENNDTTIKFDSLYKRMMTAVWYPLDYFKLSFGKSDSFKNVATFISSKQIIDNSSTAEPLLYQIENNFDEQSKVQVFTLMKQLIRWVPFRFIRPFFADLTRGLPDTNVNQTIKNLANSVSKVNPESCIYHFEGDSIVINKYWKEYLLRNLGILTAFTFWHLVKFVQKNNPNIIGITEKIFKPNQRNLRRNTESWKVYISLNKYADCIYTGEKVNTGFSLDHFVPWSYTVHDLNWNIVPITKQINSSKSDSLPSLEYLRPLTNLQHSFFHVLAEHQKCTDILEDYCLLFNRNIANIREMSFSDFELKFTETITPMIQIASNMGFKNNWMYVNR